MANWAFHCSIPALFMGGGYLDYQIVNVLSAAHPVSCSILGHDIVVIVLVVL